MRASLRIRQGMALAETARYGRWAREVAQQPALNGTGGCSREALDRLGCGSGIRSHHRTVRWQRTRGWRASRSAGACAEPTRDPGRARPGRRGTRRLDSARAVRLPGQDRLAPAGRRGEPARGGQRRERRDRRSSAGRHAVEAGRRSHRHLRGWRRGARRGRTARAGHARHGGQRARAAADGGGLPAARVRSRRPRRFGRRGRSSLRLCG